MKSEGRRSHKDHNQKLFSLQEKYLETRQPKVLERIYRVIKELAMNLVRNYFRDRGLFINREDLEVKACDIASLCIERYLRDPEFKVKRSFSGWVRNGAFLKIMFKDIHHDQADEFNEFSGNRLTDSWDSCYMDGGFEWELKLENAKTASEVAVIQVEVITNEIGPDAQYGIDNPLWSIQALMTVKGKSEQLKKNKAPLVSIIKMMPLEAVATLPCSPERKIQQYQLPLNT